MVGRSMEALQYKRYIFIMIYICVYFSLFISMPTVVQECFVKGRMLNRTSQGPPGMAIPSMTPKPVVVHVENR
jgi:hypothetical protein